MDEHLQALIINYQPMMKQGVPMQGIITDLHATGITITETMKVIRELYGLPLGEAKVLVTQYPAWKNVVDAHQEFHDELETLMVHGYSLWIEAEAWLPGCWVSGDCDTDVIVEWENGDRWVASFITYKHIQTIKEKFKGTSECLSGQYFWMSNMILIEDINRPLLQQVINDLIKNDEFTYVFAHIPKQDGEDVL